MLRPRRRPSNDTFEIFFLKRATVAKPPVRGSLNQTHMTLPTVSVTIVTHNSARWIAACLDSVFAQQGVHLDVVVVDNASTDATCRILKGYSGRLRVIANARNAGFSGAQNQAIAAASGEWVLTLNPDVLLAPGFAAALVEAGRADSRVGAVCGKLLRIRPDFTRYEIPKIDSAGMFFTPPLRHFDRGWNEVDTGQYGRTEYVFGASAAAALYRREMIHELSLDGEFFDNDFFAYREDADVAWRAQLMGWRCLYTPGALGWHVRRVTPANRAEVPAVLNMHSVKNRFLMRIKNMTAPLYRKLWWQATARDLAVIAGCLLFEHSSLPALKMVVRGIGRARQWRRHIMARRNSADPYLATWFSTDPVALPFPSALLVFGASAGQAGLASREASAPR
jgi:GT2 family glycosyltransferase